jgi:hypothetical protein
MRRKIFSEYYAVLIVYATILVNRTIRKHKKADIKKTVK